MLTARSTARGPATASRPVGAAAQASGPRPLVGLAARLNAGPHVCSLMAARTRLAPIQLKVSQATNRKDGANQGKWYSDRDPTAFFDDRAAAQAHEDAILAAQLAEQDRVRQEREQARRQQHREEMKSNFPDYVAPNTGAARLFKDQDREYDDVPLVKPTAKNVKAYAERSFAERRADEFGTQVMKLGDQHFVLQPGTDIGLTPAVLRPDLEAPRSHVPLSRDGRPKTYGDMAPGLDDAAERLAEEAGGSIQDTRSRMGKDIDRMTRGNPPSGALGYEEDERGALQEVAGVVRLDKGRVPNATKVIRKTFASGKHSFHDLLAGEKYAGAGEGGVARLRGVAHEGGRDSEGSDIAEAETVVRKRGKRRQKDDE